MQDSSRSNYFSYLTILEPSIRLISRLGTQPGDRFFGIAGSLSYCQWTYGRLCGWNQHTFIYTTSSSGPSHHINFFEFADGGGCEPRRPTTAISGDPGLFARRPIPPWSVTWSACFLELRDHNLSTQGPWCWGGGRIGDSSLSMISNERWWCEMETWRVWVMQMHVCNHCHKTGAYTLILM